MANRLGYAILATVLGANMLMGACSDDSGSSAGAEGGDSSSAGADSGGSSFGGSSAGKAGSGGKAGSTSGGMSQGGSAQAGSSTEGGAGAGGEATVGGAPTSGGAADSGAAGVAGETNSAGAAGGPSLDYACNSTTIVHKLCSALSAADCQIATECPDCVQTRTNERATFAECPACLAWNDAFYQCAIGAYESGDLSAGVECIDDPDAGIGADISWDCAMQYLFPALDCLDYLADPDNECPATWPVN